MTTATREVLGYIKRLCKKIVPGVFGMKVSRRGQWKRIKPRVGSENDDITVVDLSLRDRIKFLKHRLKQEVRSEVNNSVITIDISEKITAFMRSEKSDAYLRRILKSYTRALLQQQFKKTELQQKEILLQEKDKLIFHLLRRLESYGEGVKLGELSDYKLQGVGMMIGFAAQRWKQEHTKREADEELDQMHECVCPITKACFVNPVIATDGHTYEKSALEEWIHRAGTSPMTREPIQIVREDMRKKTFIEDLRAARQKEKLQRCELPTV